MTAVQTTTTRRTADNSAAATASEAAAEAKKKAQPKTANEVLAKVEEDHNYKHAPIRPRAGRSHPH